MRCCIINQGYKNSPHWQNTKNKIHSRKVNPISCAKGETSSEPLSHGQEKNLSNGKFCYSCSRLLGLLVVRYFKRILDTTSNFHH